MSDDFSDIKLTRWQRWGRWLETRMGYEFLCRDCNNLARHGEVGPDGSGCLGQCGLSNEQRAAEYRQGSDAYVPRVKARTRSRWGIGATD
ncbi:MAG: hypothetical protein EXQ85_00610 [Alphaproteobacteria bacterium]|nr:hypothetical protein [Alphaproteobacteria bacterium]